MNHGSNHYAEKVANSAEAQQTASYPVDPSFQNPYVSNGSTTYADVHQYHLPHFAEHPGVNLPMLPEDESLSQLLMSWYYAGYHTAQYLAQKKQKK